MLPYLPKRLTVMCIHWLAAGSRRGGGQAAFGGHGHRHRQLRELYRRDDSQRRPVPAHGE